jgi:SAM-dependent methyltransferase
MTSLSFDRAADYYDKTRSLPAEYAEQVTDLLAAEIRVPLLEVGVGTGRIALPLVERGIEVFGVDISKEMVDSFLAKDFDHSLLHVGLGDATRLPFATDAFGSAVAVHVLHLIDQWRSLCEEVLRVVEPGGRFVVDYGGWGTDTWKDIQIHFVEITGIERPRPGATSIDEIDEHMQSLGATHRRLPTITTTRTRSYSELLDRIHDGLYSFTWSLDDATREQAANETREWAAERYGDLDEPRRMEWDVALTAYELP